ncbi:MAG: ATP-binding protein [Lachnospiraceae bacterium]|jgi:signal transduction histidine kinase/PAS domain-containing protein|nr:ATP-binding protein [Lachnospiraceae bacterium]
MDITKETLENFTRLTPINTAIYHVSPDGALETLFLSENIPALLDLSREEYLKITEHDAMDLTIPEDRAALQKATVQSIRTGLPFEHYYRVFHKEKGFEWIHVHAHTCGSMDGRPLIIANFSNMTEEGGIYQEILDTSDRMAFVLDRETLEVLYANRKARNAGHSGSNLLDQTCHSYLFGRREVCESCFLNEGGRTETAAKVVFEPDTGKWEQYTKIPIHWCGHDAVMLLIMDVTAEKKAEQETERYQKLYEDAAQASRLVIWTYEPEKHQANMATNGYTGEIIRKLGLPFVIENVPDSMVSYVDERDRDKFLGVYRAIENGEDSASCEFRFRLPKQESQQYEHMTFHRITDENGRLLTVHCCGQNITSQKEAQEEYEKLRGQITSELIDAVFSAQLDITRNTCISVFSPHREMEEAIRQKTADASTAAMAGMVLNEEARQRVLRRFTCENLIEEYRNGRRQVMENYAVRIGGESRMWVQTMVCLMQNPQMGDIEAIVFSKDITEQKRSEEILSRISGSSFDFIDVLDLTDSTFLIYDGIWKDKGDLRAMEKAPYAPEMEKMAERSVVPEERQNFLEGVSVPKLQEELFRSPVYTFSFTVVDGDEGRRNKQILFRWLNDDKKEILFAQQDITETYRREQEQIHALQQAKYDAERANEAKSMFLSGMSHDLRTPLNGVIGFTELAISEDDPDKKQAYLTKIRSSGTLLLDLVNDTLEISRIESGKYTLQPEAVNGRELGESVVTAMRPSAEMKGIKLVAGPEDFPEVTLWADRLKIQKILLNLVSNAIKFTPAGGTVRAYVRQLDPPVHGNNFRIVVQDTGIGIQPQFLPYIFEPFSQENRKTEGGSGTGLGLSIVKKIVELMDGEISVRSTPGKGTCFTVDLHLDPADSAPAQENSRYTGDELRGLRVLLCEDNYLNTEIAVILLQQCGIAADCAADGKEGLEKFSRSAEGYYDAILMDIRMPVMDGYEAAAAIRSLQRGDAESIPIIAMTADAFDESFHSAKKAGMTGYVTKPVEARKLYEELRKACTDRREPEDNA